MNKERKQMMLAKEGLVRMNIQQFYRNLAEDQAARIEA